MTEKIIYFLIILSASCINNLIIPFAIYIKRYGLFKNRNKDFIGCNVWGIVMDGVLAGLINIIALNFILTIQPKLLTHEIKLALFWGMAASVGIHVLMATTAWKIWIMPRPWHWNLAGYWHMISFFIQMSFLFYPLIIIWQQPLLLSEKITKFSLGSVFFLGILFFLSLYFSRRGLKIGKLFIDHRPW